MLVVAATDQKMTAFGYVVFLLCGVVQLGVMVKVISSWTGSTVLALIISFVGSWIPIPWFVIGHRYFEGTLPWIYIIAWIVGWGTLAFQSILTTRMGSDGSGGR